MIFRLCMRPFSAPANLPAIVPATRSIPFACRYKPILHSIPCRVASLYLTRTDSSRMMPPHGLSNAKVDASCPGQLQTTSAYVVLGALSQQMVILVSLDLW